MEDRYAWPGSYERYAIMDDGEVLCIPCVNDPRNPVHDSTKAAEWNNQDGWGIVGYDNMGNTDESKLVCAHCGRDIE